MPVYDWDSIRVCNGYLVRRNPDELAIFLMALVDCQVPPTPSAIIHVPEVGELRKERTWDVLNGPISDIWQDKVEDWQCQ